MSEPPHDWDGAYRAQQPAPWDIGRPQPAVVALADRLTGDVLDAGCGTGEHTLLAAERGARATGVDLSESAIHRARQKAAERHLAASFAVADMLSPGLPRRGFDVVLDVGLFHVFTDSDRARYVEVLGGLLRPGGCTVLACFSDRQPGDWGPRRVSAAEIEAAFADGWRVEHLEPATFDINPGYGEATVAAWAAVLRRT